MLKGVVRTGCFSVCRIYKVVDSAAADPTYVMQYHCQSIEEYHRCRDSFAPSLQKEHFGLPGAFEVPGQLLEEVAQAMATNAEPGRSRVGDVDLLRRVEHSQMSPT